MDSHQIANKPLLKKNIPWTRRITLSWYVYHLVTLKCNVKNCWLYLIEEKNISKNVSLLSPSHGFSCTVMSHCGILTTHGVWDGSIHGPMRRLLAPKKHNLIQNWLASSFTGIRYQSPDYVENYAKLRPHMPEYNELIPIYTIWANAAVTLTK